MARYKAELTWDFDGKRIAAVVEENNPTNYAIVYRYPTFQQAKDAAEKLNSGEWEDWRVEYDAAHAGQQPKRLHPIVAAPNQKG